jgi:hypothetical protein
MCGIHAQMMGTTDVQVWARRDAARPGVVAHALWEERSLVRAWCMRGTLHLLTPAQFATYAAAFDPAATYGPTWHRAFEVTPAEMARLHEALAEALEPGEPLTRRELGAAVAASAGERLGARLSSSWGELLKPSARRGLFVNGPSRGAETTYVRADRWLGASRSPPADAAAARLEWLRAYLRAFGPADAADHARWMGIRQVGRVGALLRTLGDEVTEVSVAGRRLFALTEDVDVLRSEADAASAATTRLLPAFDTYLLGHADREHLIDAGHRPEVYRTAGWISPTVLSGGRIAGTWEHAVAGSTLELRVTPFAPLTPAQRAGVEAEAARLAAFFELTLSLYT